MCLTIDKNFHCYNKPRIADKDLVCYKVLLQVGWLFKRFYSPYFYFEWEKNVEYATTMRTSPAYATTMRTPHYVDKGFHAWISKELIDIEKFHDFLTPFNGKWKPHKKILVECIIPEGSEYYIGESNDIVSNKMKFVKIIK